MPPRRTASEPRPNSAASTPQKLKKRGLWSAPEVAEMISELIEGGALQPGERIRELDLVERFGVSRTPIREALRILEARRAIRIEPMRGATVMRLSDEALQQALEIRGALLGLAALRAAEHATPKERTELLRMARSLEAGAPAAMAPRAFAEESAVLATLVVRAAHSEQLRDGIHMFHQGGPRVFDPVSFASAQARRSIARAWAKIAEHIVEGQGAKAEALVRKVHADAVAAALELRPFSSAP